jgi:hypothetical protein
MTPVCPSELARAVLPTENRDKNDLEEEGNDMEEETQEIKSIKDDNLLREPMDLGSELSSDVESLSSDEVSEASDMSGVDAEADNLSNEEQESSHQPAESMPFAKPLFR